MTKLAFGKVGKNVVTVAVIRLASIVLTLAFFQVLAQAMSAEAFGIFSIAYSLAIILSYFSTVGQHVAVLRFWPAIDQSHGHGVASRVLFRGMVLTLMGGTVAALGVVALTLNPTALQAFGGSAANLMWAGLFVLIAGMVEFTTSALRAKGSVVLSLVPRDVAWRLLVIVLVFFMMRPLPADMALALVALALLLVSAPQYFTLIAEIWRYRKQRLPEEELRRMNSAVWSLWANTSMKPVIDHATTILVGLALGPAAAGAFFAADRLAKLLGVALVGIEQITVPMISRSFYGGRLNEVRLTTAVTSTLTFATAAVGVLAYLLFGRFVLQLFNPEYVDAYPVLITLAVGQLINNACGSNSALLNVADRGRDLLIIQLIWGAVMLGSVYFATQEFGILGAALVSSGVLIGWNVSATIVCKLKLDVMTVFPLSLLELSSQTDRKKD